MQIPENPRPFEDGFSSQAETYARYRPGYPRELFVWLADQAPTRELAWDCGTGNGQAAVQLAEFFVRVLATDASTNQIAHAKPHPRVTYFVAKAESFHPGDATIDLVTVAQALHWFDLDVFFRNVERVLRPGGVFAAWSYKHAQVAPAVDALLHRFNTETVGRYWSPRVRLAEEGYAGLEMPLADVGAAPAFTLRAHWTVDDFLGYLSSWSSVRECWRQTGQDPVRTVAAEFRRAWGAPPLRREIRWPLALRVGRKTP
jgi:SAM-dependent methyltransferase